MLHRSLSLALCLSVSSILGLMGCASTQEPQAELPTAEVGRNGAIAAAKSDAALRFAHLQITTINAHTNGPYWVVELKNADGAGLRYAISRTDGSIRQRSVFQ